MDRYSGGTDWISRIGCAVRPDVPRKQISTSPIRARLLIARVHIEGPHQRQLAQAK